MDVALSSSGPASTLEPDSHKNERPKKTKRTSNPVPASSSSHDAAVNKPKQTKSRNGCSTCKAKRLKCDETKPICLQCTKRGVVCGGYKKEFKWRSATEDSFDFKVSSGPTPKQTPPKSSTTPPRPSSNSRQPADARDQKPRPSLSTSSSSTSALPPSSSRPPQHISVHPPGLNDVVLNPLGTLPPPTPPPQTQPLLYQTYQDIPLIQPGQSPQYQDVSQQGYHPRMPSISDLLAQDNQFNSQLPEIQSPFPADGSLPPGWNTSAPPPAPPPVPVNFDEEEEVEEIVRDQPPLQDDTPWSADISLFNNGTVSGSNDLVVTRNNEPSIFVRPHLDNTSWEMLFSAFDRNTCAIMSVRNGMGDNPWREVIGPLVRNSSALRFAVAAMSAFHSSFDIPSLRQQAVAYVSESSRALINEPNEKPEIVLASTLAMAFADSWDSGEESRTGLDYIKVARKLVPRVLHSMQVIPYSSSDRERITFLCKTWIYIDVIARLTSIDEDVSDECEEVSLQLAGPMNQETRIDPLMGSASTLFPIIGRVANLVRRVCKLDVNSADIIATAMELKGMLETWNAPAPFTMPRGDQHELISSLHTAEAYRWSTLLYLHQAVPEIPSLDSEFMAREALSHLAQVPMESQIVIVQIYPLFAAGCEANDEETRRWVLDRWQAMAQRMRIGNTYRCGQVVEEVWRRRDEYQKYQMTRAHLQRAHSMPEGYGDYIEPPPFGFDSTRRATFPNNGNDFNPESLRSRSVDLNAGNIDPEFTVRGRLHWVSVMKDNKWESKS